MNIREYLLLRIKVAGLSEITAIVAGGELVRPCNVTVMSWFGAIMKTVSWATAAVRKNTGRFRSTA
ncbi:MAG: hypothetical protein ACM3YE_06275 [Bacteroidota bacterium]